MMGSEPRNDKAKVALSRDVVKEIKKCFICPLCGKTMEETVSLKDCMHSFCKKCIYEKLEDEDPKECPVCNREIGPNLDNYLRPDNVWRGVIETIEARIIVARTSDDQSRVGETSSQANPSIDRSTSGKFTPCA
ncbi:hypothetical protein L6452_21468 [Arctium lappa]|uniref:Uncharacterized protein n=1 Tax=Arctium lappa TaxID=4217 RepID=A0ACB9AYS3_ARCLA|nr:hypothetical protein L6452_21468 [Arctium lappa]